MPTIDRETSTLLIVDFQSRLMPAIEDGAAVVANVVWSGPVVPP